jgi:hypothetical protein
MANGQVRLNRCKEGDFFGKTQVLVQGENQMIINLLKQKMGIANKGYWVNFNPIYNRLDEVELRKIDLNLADLPGERMYQT